MSATTIGLYVCCVLFETSQQLLFKLSGRTPLWRWRALLGGVLLYLCQLACWYKLLTYWPLGIALPLMGINYATIAIGGKYFFSERLTLRHGVSIALIIAGVAIICVRAGDLL